jgi:ABC-type multidrug transport system fused ATPase/permease subunit
MFELCGGLPDAARALDAGLTAWRRLARVAHAAPVVRAPAEPTAVSWNRDSVLEFDGVSATWPGAYHEAVRDVSFLLHAEEHIVLSGPSGIGKSTVAALAARHLDPGAGRVLIDGTDLRDADPARIRELVTVVDQDAHLFDTSIRENLLIADPKAAEEQLWSALAAVGLDGWVASLPQGLDTPVGRSGDEVSGGERRRICLARGLLSPAPVLVLDEPAAHLDAATADEVAARLARRLTGRTVIWIQHDPADAARTLEVRRERRAVESPARSGAR